MPETPERRNQGITILAVVRRQLAETEDTTRFVRTGGRLTFLALARLVLAELFSRLQGLDEPQSAECLIELRAANRAEQRALEAQQRREPGSVLPERLDTLIARGTVLDRVWEEYRGREPSGRYRRQSSTAA